MRHRLRLFTGDDELEFTNAEPPTSVRLGDFTRALNDALRWNRSWVEDFENEQIQLPPDLYEVLAAYLEMRPGA